MKFVRWLWKVIRKGVWLLGIFPTLLDYISAYIPGDYIPTHVSDFLGTGGSQNLTLFLAAGGMLVGAFLVHLETEARLADYEHQAPEYELKIKEVTSDFCGSGCHVEVHCHLSIMGTNPFKGELEYITVSSEGQIRGLGRWKIHGAGYGGARSRLPVTVPNSECDLVVVVHAKIEEETPEPSFRDAWKDVEFSLQLMTGYSTQPVGYVQKPLLVNIPIDLGEQFDALAASRRKTSG